MEEWIAKHLKLANNNHNKTGDIPHQHVTLKTDVYQLPLDIIFSDIHDVQRTSQIQKSGNVDDNAAIEGETVFDHRQDIKYAKGLKGLTCLTCGLVFTTRSEQQQHFSSDYHLFNLKRSLKKKPAVSLEEFLDISEGQKSSSSTALQEYAGEESGGEDEDDRESDPEDQEVSSVEEDSDKEENVESAGDLSYRYQYEDATGKVRKVFQSNAVGPVFKVLRNNCLPWHFSLSLALFHNNNRLAGREWNHSPTDSNLSLWHDLYHQLQYLRLNPIMTVFILRSGKFAGAVFDNRRNKANHNQNPLLIHKVLRRYTVRAKAGGGQSSHDNKGSKAKSMGAQLRRYGEKALKEDIQNILTLWQGYIQSSGLILIATTKRMRGILFDKDGSDTSNSIVLLKKDDPRIVSVPFVVDRPTLESAEMIRERALQVVISSDDFHPAAEQLPSQPLKPALKKEKLETVTPTPSIQPELKDDIVDCSISKDLIAACSELNDDVAKSKVKEIVEKFQKGSTNITQDEDEEDDSNTEAYCDGWKLSMVINLPASLQELETPLHIATAKNHVNTVTFLLLHGADPERVDARGRTSYFIAQTKEMRDAFRKVRAELGESKWNWSKAGVPEPLTDEKIAQQKQKEKEKKKRAQQRKKELKIKADQEEKDRQLAVQLQEELRIKEQQDLERREKDKAGNCEFCLKSLYKTDFFDALGKRCCSTDCVAKLRRKLVADAALARLSNNK